MISKRNQLKLRKDLDNKSIELLRVSIQNDYEDLMKTPCSKHFLNSANNEIMAKRFLQKKLPPNMLPDSTRFDKANPLNLIPSDESGDEDPLFDDTNDNVPDPNEIPDLSPSNPQMWRFYNQNHETLLTIPELPDDVNTFILEMMRQSNSDAAFKLCTENYATAICEITFSLTCSKPSQIPIHYVCGFYKTIDGNDMLECDSIGHTEVDNIVKIFLYIVDGLNKDLGIRQKWQVNAPRSGLELATGKRAFDGETFEFDKGTPKCYLELAKRCMKSDCQ
ncbi:5710_t:CDS:2, partial [Dentiscutata erythropus]